MPLPITEYLKEFFNKEWAERFFNAKTPPVEKPDRFLNFPVSIMYMKCTSCQRVEDICPVDAIGQPESGDAYPAIDKDRCIRCGRCSEICPNLISINSEVKELSK
ncbi:hypothetical protein AKJ51_03125 [candidate division MSBL1 archaeon SCGC-AAA382A20]|uniref:4Fe-4S ferredoxin-type domain-containing protein n=1 Tax=candidate division MSBL1 archaeon SCGC-AAA382A20 TaxID=1698280 RepID=A0A133VJT2_9EURY|nr:hypothetical protein AKJ51_03125 [candidate division MSBL1 archaeon SCGC-AAA382A20]